MVRDRIVADDWLLSIKANHYSVPFALIGKTVQVVRQGGSWLNLHRGAVVAEHAGAGWSCTTERAAGPGAAADTCRQLHAGRPPPGPVPVDLSREVEVRDLAIYEHLLTTPAEVAA